MARVNLFRLLSRIGLGPSPATIARQLRKPSGKLAARVGRAMNRSNSPLYDFLMEVMDPQPGEHILEIGFGNGKMFPQLFRYQPEVRITGLDYSDAMVRSASHHNDKAIRSGRLDLHLGSSDHMPFKDQSFDKVFCINVLYFWDNPGVHLGEVLRVLKPGGTFLPVIRSRESLKLVPFTKYGFLLREDHEWADIISAAGFADTDIRRYAEPSLEFNDKRMKPDSLCIISKKAG
jgi:SAM-dependent methyltransferase